jgi:iron complex outermembrane receptor protein
MMRIPLLPLILIVALSVSANAGGDERDLFGDLPDIVGASKYEQPTASAPSSVSIVTSNEIRAYGYRTLADILRSLRGFTVRYDRIYSYLGARGFDRPGDFNSRILVLIDGHRINDGVYDSATVGNEFPLDVDLIDRVEVIRGPGSALYGGNAFFAVVNVVSRKGRVVDGAELSGSAGSFGTWKGRATAGKRRADGLEALLSASVLDSRGQTVRFPEYADPATNGGVVSGMDGERAEDAYASIGYRDLTFNGVYGRREKSFPTAAYGTEFGAPGAGTRDRFAFAELKYDRLTDRQDLVALRVYHDDYEYSGDYPYADAAVNPVPPHRFLNRDRGRARTLGGEVRLTGSIFEAHRVTGGLEYRNGYRQDQVNENESPPSTILNDHRSNDSFGIFLADEYALREDLTLTAGARFDHFRSFGNTLNPRLALIWAPWAGCDLKLMAGRAFRPPSVYESRYADGLTMKPNPDLRPETITTYEAAWEQFLGAHLRIVASLYHYRIHDLIGLETDPADAMTVFRNRGRVRATGAEAEIEGRWETGVEGRVGYAVQKAVDDSTGREIDNSPRHTAKLNVAAPLVRDRLVVGFESQFASRRNTPSGGRAGAASISNLTMTSLGRGGFPEVSCSIYNLFDRPYGEPADIDQRQNTIPQDGRNYRLKLSVAF